jgi:peroxiredoxin
MDSTPPPLAPISAPSPKPRAGLAIASLVLGILAFLSSFFVVGALFGLAGLILGLVHLTRKQGRNGLAWTGIALSCVSILISVAMVVVAAKFIGPKMQELKTAFAGLGQTSGGEEMDLWQGVPAPDFSVTTLDGQTLKLSELKGKRVVVDFWATWCPPCVKEIPHFIQLRAETPADEVVIVGISSEDAETLRPFLKQKGINYPIAATDDLPAPYKDVASIPTTFFIDRNGIIQHIAVGYHDFDALKAHATAKNYEGETKSPPAAPQEDHPESAKPL